MITSKISKSTILQKSQSKHTLQEQERLRREFVAQIKKEVEASTYEIKSREIAEKVGQRIKEEAAMPKFFLKNNRY